MKLQYIPKPQIEVDGTFLAKTAGSIALMANFYEYSEEYNNRLTSILCLTYKTID